MDHHVLLGEALHHGPYLGVRAEGGEHRGVLEAVVHRHEAAQLSTVLSQGQAGRAAEGAHRRAYVGGRRLAAAYLRARVTRAPRARRGRRRGSAAGADPAACWARGEARGRAGRSDGSPRRARAVGRGLTSRSPSRRAVAATVTAAIVAAVAASTAFLTALAAQLPSATALARCFTSRAGSPSCGTVLCARSTATSSAMMAPVRASGSLPSTKALTRSRLERPARGCGPRPATSCSGRARGSWCPGAAGSPPRARRSVRRSRSPLPSRPTRSWAVLLLLADQGERVGEQLVVEGDARDHAHLRGVPEALPLLDLDGTGERELDQERAPEDGREVQRRSATGPSRRRAAGAADPPRSRSCAHASDQPREMRWRPLTRL